jgi:4'-phosphopantetheinyl transferase EntD
VRSELVDTPHGRCLILKGEGDLHALGRAAMCEALAMPGLDIPRDDRGAPVIPAGWLGSISHKHERAAALVARDDGTGARIGVDLEVAAEPRQPIESRVLRPRELAALRDRREVTLYFAIKEAIYKAVDPFVRRFVGFTEVELALADGGACVVTSELSLAIEAWWCERDGHWLATARAVRPRNRSSTGSSSSRGPSR